MFGYDIDLLLLNDEYVFFYPKRSTIFFYKGFQVFPIVLLIEFILLKKIFEFTLVWIDVWLDILLILFERMLSILTEIVYLFDC